jgi:hypothetical protein
MELKMTIDDDLDDNKLKDILEQIRILSENEHVNLDNKSILCITDELLTIELGKGDVSLSEDEILDLENVNKINDINKNFDITNLLQNLSNDYKELNLKNLMEIDISFFEEHPDFFNWTMISTLELPEDYMHRNIDRLDMKMISQRELCDEFILENANKLYLPYLISTNDLYSVLTLMFNREDIHQYLPFIKTISELNKNILSPFDAEVRDLKIDNILND